VEHPSVKWNVDAPMGAEATEKRRQPPATAVEKALDVLEALSETGPEVELAGIAAATSLSKPTAHRMLQILIRRGYAQQIADGVYGPGSRMLYLAGRVASHLDYAAVARPALKVLQERSPDTVHFAMLFGNYAVYVEKLDGRRAYTMASVIGAPLPLHSTAIGKAILANLPPARVAELLGDEPLARRTGHTIVDRELLAAHLRMIAARGFAVDDEENEQGIRCVGAAVFDRVNRVRGAVSLSAPSFDLSLDAAHAAGPRVVEAARSVSLSLGASPAKLPPAYATAPS
jgi:IclR family acetate operon transcriptional repressor